jgi:adenine-specific DNA-methyltransferase
MASIEVLIAQIPDEKLRKAIADEVKILKKTKKFGLVFEEHLPETVRLSRLPVRAGEQVALKREIGNKLWRVREVKEGVAECDPAVEGYAVADQRKTFPIDDLVVVRSFGEPIYPALVPVDRVARGGPDRPWHTLINADNFHALQLLLYAYEGQVDVIYIDPPYNTGARDWKYNNDYVDTTDAFRHSKWLSMMKKRLLLARRLLKQDGVLIVTIDEHEVHHLGVLLEQTLSDCAQQMVTIVINQKGVSQGRLARVEEYAIYSFMPQATVHTHHDDLLSLEKNKATKIQAPRWERLLRGGNNSRREDRPKLFYPIFIDPVRKVITSVGDVLPLSEAPDLTNANSRTVAWPIRTDGSLGNWQAKPSTLRALIEGGYVKLGGFDQKRQTWTVLYLNKGSRNRIEKGELTIVGRDAVTGAIEVAYANDEAKQLNIKTVWHRGAHDSGIYGSSVLRYIVGDEVDFDFPKSLYAVRDALGAVARHKKDALILDFFAGSGTTFHATALLNAQDGGRRRCILVTNNEVKEKVVKQLIRLGIEPGDETYENNGICQSVTWPRCRNATLGQRLDGTAISGEYLDGRAIADGFDENLEYFRLDFVDPAQVARGDAFHSILPILWMMAGCCGEREDSKGSMPWFIPKHSPFAVLIQERQFRAFRDKLSERDDIEWVFIVTDSEENFAALRRALGRGYRCVQLYKSYLENFRLNTQEALSQSS